MAPAPVATVRRLVGIRLTHGVSVAAFRRVTPVLLVVTGAVGTLNAVAALVG